MNAGCSRYLNCADVILNTDDIVGLGKDDAEKQYILVVKRLVDTYGL